jgi:hypothetical protein
MDGLWLYGCRQCSTGVCSEVFDSCSARVEWYAVRNGPLRVGTGSSSGGLSLMVDKR